MEYAAVDVVSLLVSIALLKVDSPVGTVEEGVAAELLLDATGAADEEEL